MIGNDKMMAAAGQRSSQPQWLQSGLVLIVYLLIPTAIWSAVYQQPKIVADPLILLPLELVLPSALRVPIRLGWATLSAMMLLLEWNIFPESYFFYLRLTTAAWDTHQVRSLAFAAALVIAFFLLPTPRPPTHRPVVVGALLCGYVLILIGKRTDIGQQSMVAIRVPIVRALQVAVTDGPRLLSASVSGHGGPVQSGRLHDLILGAQVDRLPPKILVVVLESWGESSAGLVSVSAKIVREGWRVRENGFEPFSGSTLPGEYRTLCGRKLDFRRITAAPDDCLPRRLASLSYKTVALHGYDGVFYYRNLVYPALGFQKIVFRPALQNMPQCAGAFPGPCDTDVMKRAISLLRASGRQFVYVMSLNGHAPVDPALLRRIERSGMMLGQGASDTQTVNRDLIVSTLRLIPPAVRGNVLIYFVGDHNPPDDANSSYVTPGKVPYLLVSQ